MERAEQELDAFARGGDSPDERDLELVSEMSTAYRAIETELGKRIVGQREVIDQLLIAMFARGHCLFVGVPGLAKTLLINTLAEVLSLRFNRIQFTPDLMPSDITGTDVLEQDQATGQRSFRFIRGPIFCNVLLADEINRTPPKTQAALLQSMQELQVTAGGRTHLLEPPYLVFATQNPIEQEGTYPLPEAQLDRFMFEVEVGYPSLDEEREIVRRTTAGSLAGIRKVLDPDRILELQALVPRVPVPEHVIDFAVDLARRTRPLEPLAPQYVKDHVSWGAGPRASQFLVLAAKARAVLEGRFAATVADVRAMARPVLRHRIITNFHAEASGISASDVVKQLIDETRSKLES
jgi:MoxR-like ATPase